MRKTISKILVFFLIFALTVLITLLYSLPKAVLIDRFLMSKGINLIASRAEESLFSIKLERGSNSAWQRSYQFFVVHLPPGGLPES